MLKNYLKIALRNLRKHKAYSLINVAGLAIGLACFTLIVLFVQDELSYDRYHPDADRLYRIAIEIEASEGATRNAQSPPLWTTALLESYPEVEKAVRFKPPRQTWMVRYQDRQFSEKTWVFADSSVFEVFGVNLRRGTPETALTAPFTVVISEAMVEKYFRDEDPIGKTITIDNQYDFAVTGVFEDVPDNTHFHFDFLASFVSMNDPQTLYLLNVLEFPFPFSYNYVLLEEGATKEAFEAKMPGFIEAHVPPQFLQGGRQMRAFLQPITDIHLHSTLENEIEANGDASVVYIFLAVGLFILLIACVNFMNLATARSASRAKEVGMRKVVGAQRRHLIGQFLGESALLALVALVLAMVLVALALPTFGSLTGKAITIGTLIAPTFVLALIGVALTVGLLAGSYPAFFLSAFRPAAVLKGELRAGAGRGTWLRKGLIVFQFFISIGLIIGTGIVYNQMQYARDKKLGFDKEHVVVVQMTDPNASRHYQSFKDAVLQHPNVLNVSAGFSTPGGLIGQATMRPFEDSQEQSWQMLTYFTDFDFVETMGMEIAAGRDFSTAFSTDSTNAMLINETAARAFGWHDPNNAVGKDIVFAGNNAQPIRVIGVVKDFHSQSVREKIAPTVIGFGGQGTPQWFFAFVRIQPGDIPGTIASLEQTFEQVIPGYAFLYSFLDEDFEKLYKSEAVLGSLLGYFALLTIFIACLGLFGLASFTAEQRTKEIGVRKTLGASVGNIIVLLSKEFTTLVVIAFVVAAPAALWAMTQWLEGFAYSMDLVGAWWIFLGAGAAALLIAWLTVGYQSIRAALTNPVEALRYE